MARKQTRTEEQENQVPEEKPQGEKLENEPASGAKDQGEQYKELAQRIQAEFDNFRKRNVSARQEAREDGVMTTVMAVLPVLDSMEQAEKMYVKEKKTEMAEGFSRIIKQFLDQLAGIGVVRMECTGKPFDPNLHEAMMQAAGTGKESGMITEIFRNGYLLGEKVIRHAQVIVAQ